jgi:hypothetical protein
MTSICWDRKAHFSDPSFLSRLYSYLTDSEVYLSHRIYIFNNYTITYLSSLLPSHVTCTIPLFFVG